jgi:hypothetical protein
MLGAEGLGDAPAPLERWDTPFAWPFQPRAGESRVSAMRPAPDRLNISVTEHHLALQTVDGADG